MNMGLNLVKEKYALKLKKKYFNLIYSILTYYYILLCILLHTTVYYCILLYTSVDYCILLYTTVYYCRLLYLGTPNNHRSGRVLDSRPKGRGFEPHRRHCVVSLSKNIKPSLVLVQHRKTRPFITERLLMGRKESNQTNKKNNHYHILKIADEVIRTNIRQIWQLTMHFNPLFCANLMFLGRN